jgi:hypothetical protein
MDRLLEFVGTMMKAVILIALFVWAVRFLL